MGSANRRARQGLSIVLIAVVTLAAMGVPTVRSHAQQCFDFGFPNGYWQIANGSIVSPGYFYDPQQIDVNVHFPVAFDPQTVMVFGGPNSFSLSNFSNWEIDYTSYASLNGLQIESYINRGSGPGLSNWKQSFQMYPSQAIEINMRASDQGISDWAFYIQHISICGYPLYTQTPAASITPFFTFTPTPSVPPAFSPTPTRVPPTWTPSHTPTPTNTPTPRPPTNTPTPTHTPPPSSTPTPSDTPPPGATDTDTPPPSSTPTASTTLPPTFVPPTETPADTPSPGPTLYIDPAMFSTVPSHNICADPFHPCGALPFPVPPFPTINLPSPTALPVTPFSSPVYVFATSTGTVTPVPLTTDQAALVQLATNAQGAVQSIVVTPGLNGPPGSGAGGVADLANSANQIGEKIGEAFGVVRAVQGFFIGKTGSMVAFLLLILMFIILVRLVVFVVPILINFFRLIVQVMAAILPW